MSAHSTKSWTSRHRMIPLRRLRRTSNVLDATHPRERRELDPGTCCADWLADPARGGEDCQRTAEMELQSPDDGGSIARIKKSCRQLRAECAGSLHPAVPNPAARQARTCWLILVAKFDDIFPYTPARDLRTAWASTSPKPPLCAVRAGP